MFLYSSLGVTLTALIFSRAIIFWATVLAVVAVEERILLFTEKTFTVSVLPVLLNSFNSMLSA